MKRFFIFIIIVFSFLSSFAQSATEQFSEIDLLEIRQRYADVMKEFQSYLAKIGNEHNSKEIRQNALNASLNLFVNKGEGVDSLSASYVHIIQDGKKIRTQRLKSFLDNYALLGKEYLKHYRLMTVDFDIKSTNVEDCGDGLFRLKINVRPKPTRNQSGSDNYYSYFEFYLYIKKIEVDEAAAYIPLLTNVIFENIRQTK